MEALKPCPFCGGNAKLSGKRSGGLRREATLYYALCKRCKARGPIVKGPDGEFDGVAYIGGMPHEQAEAARLWNEAPRKHGIE